MKYIEIFLMLICLNLSMTIVDNLCLIPLSNYGTACQHSSGVMGFSDFTEDYQMANNDVLGSKVVNLTETATYDKTTLQTNIFQDVDFLTGLWIVTEIIGQGLFNVGPTMNALHIPAELHFMFIIPLTVMYLLTLFQVISGRNVEANK